MLDYSSLLLIDPFHYCKRERERERDTYRTMGVMNKIYIGVAHGGYISGKLTW